MQLADIPQAERAERLRQGICFRSGPFTVKLKSRVRGFASTFFDCYGDLDVAANTEVAHFRVEIQAQRGLRRYIGSQAVFYFEGLRPFDPYPLDQAFPLFEWGFNWCVATTAHQYLMLHSAVVERHGAALILPALPGSGKSTLAAALVCRGWRLLSDEFGIVNQDSGRLLPMPRAAPLKNESIEVMKRFAPEARFGPRFDKTRKGTVVHMFPPVPSLQQQHVTVPAAMIVFPKYAAGAALELTKQEPADAFIRLVNNSFNYQITGERGFNSLHALVSQARCRDLLYSELDTAIAAIEEQFDEQLQLKSAESG